MVYETNIKVGAVSLANMGIRQLTRNIQTIKAEAKMTKRTQKNDAIKKRKKKVFTVDTGIEFLNVEAL